MCEPPLGESAKKLRYDLNGMRYLLYHSNDTLERQHRLGWYEVIGSGDEIVELRHVHPNFSFVVSPGDVMVAKKIQKQNPNATFFIDIPLSEQSRKYDSNSNAGQLQELIVYP